MTVLERICADKRDHVAARRRSKPLSEVEAAARAAPPPRGFTARIARTIEAGEFALIAEIKRASPSKGVIRADFDPQQLARAYSTAGATCLSVVTDKPWFQGDDTYLTAARNVVNLPVLRKDFILDPYQVFEARSLGADCVLLIMAALDDDLARDLAAIAHELRMDVLVEVHDAVEAARAVSLQTRLIGINNRNLKTLAVDTQTTLRIAPTLPDDRIVVSESGLSSRDDLLAMGKAGVHCFLVGEALMREADVVAATRALLGRSCHPAAV